MLRGILWQVRLLQQSLAWEKQSTLVSVDAGQAENKVMLCFRFGDRCPSEKETIFFFSKTVTSYRKTSMLLTELQEVMHMRKSLSPSTTGGFMEGTVPSGCVWLFVQWFSHD